MVSAVLCLNDDFSSGSNEIVVKLINDLTEEYIKPKNVSRLFFCPQGYNKHGQDRRELEAMKRINNEVLIFWTGKVCKLSV